MNPVSDGKDDGGAKKFFSCDGTNLLAKKSSSCHGANNSAKSGDLLWQPCRLYHIRLSAGPYFAVQQINMYWVNQIWTLILIPFLKLQNILLVANFPPIYACFYWHSSPNRALNDIIWKWKKFSFYKSWKKESLHHTSPLKVTYVTMLWPPQSHFKMP